MSKCIDCAWFPWKPGADYSYLPSIRCHPELKSRLWVGDTAEKKHECPKFQLREGVEVKPKHPSLTVSELEIRISTIAELSELEALLKEEREGPNRKTAVKVIEDRMEELKNLNEAPTKETGEELKGDNQDDPDRRSEGGTEGTA